jgi:hypothetical protein
MSIGEWFNLEETTNYEIIVIGGALFFIGLMIGKIWF